MDAIKPIKGNIIVSCDLLQKEEALIGNNLLKTGKNYNENFRERNPVVACVERGNKDFHEGTYIICNYNYFDLESPFEITKNLYSIPVNEEIYAIVDDDGNLIPVCGNVLVKRKEIENYIDLPEELKKNWVNQGIALTGTFKDDLIFWLPYSDYEIVYQWNGEERRAIKIYEKEITGYLK